MCVREEATELAGCQLVGGPLGQAEAWGPCAAGTGDALEVFELAGDVSGSVCEKAALEQYRESTGGGQQGAGKIK